MACVKYAAKVSFDNQMEGGKLSENAPLAPYAFSRLVREYAYGHWKTMEGAYSSAIYGVLWVHRPIPSMSA